MLTQQPRTEGTLEQSLPQVMQRALEQFERAAKTCEWCAERCIGEGSAMAECIRLCRDTADIASINARFVARDSSYGPELAQQFVTIARACAQECAQHQHPHCQQCAQVLSEAIRATQQLLQSLPSMAGQQTQRQQGGGQQVQSQQGGRSMGSQSLGQSGGRTSGQSMTGQPTTGLSAGTQSFGGQQGQTMGGQQGQRAGAPSRLTTSSQTVGKQSGSSMHGIQGR